MNELDQLKEEIKKLKQEIELTRDNTYTLIMWPDSQDYMEKYWFNDEAVLSDDSSYFIPTNRL